MFAIIKNGGKQYRVQQQQTIAVEKLPGGVGAQVVLRDVILLGFGGAEGVAVAGEPVIADACVRAEIVRQDRFPKVRVFKKKRRKKYRRTFGHRQQMTWLRIDGIELPKDIFPGVFAEEPVKEAVGESTIQAETKAKPEAEAASKSGAEGTKYKTKTFAPKRNPDDIKSFPGADEANKEEPNPVKPVEGEDAFKAAGDLAETEDEKE